MVQTEQQHGNDNIEHETLKFRIARLDYALTQLAPHDDQEPSVNEVSEAATYINQEVENATPENMTAILEEINRAYEARREG